MLFPVALSKDGDRILTAGGSQADAVKAEAIAGCKDKNWSCLQAYIRLGEQNYQRRETGTNNFVRKWPGTNNMAACSRVAS